MTLTRIEVGGEAPYPVIIGTGVLAELPQLVGPDAGTVAVIYPAGRRHARTSAYPPGPHGRAGAV